MPQVDVARKHSRKPALIAGAVALLVIVAIVGVVAAINLLKGPQKATKVVMNDAREKAFGGNDDGAIALLRQQLKDTHNNDEKLALNMQLGATLENKGDNQGALAAYKSADGIKSSFGTAQSVARMAEATGDKALALKNYEKCRDLIKKGGQSQNSDFLPSIEESITRLGGTL